MTIIHERTKDINPMLEQVKSDLEQRLTNVKGGAARAWSNRLMLERYRDGIEEVSTLINDLDSLHAQTLLAALRGLYKHATYKDAEQMETEELHAKLLVATELAEALVITIGFDEYRLQARGQL